MKRQLIDSQLYPWTSWLLHMCYLLIRLPVKSTDADAAFRPIESVPLKYKNTESDIVTPAT